MATYIEWNDALTEYFFRPEHTGEPVYLSVTEDVIKDVAKSLGTTRDDFIRAVREGPPWVTKPGICQKALQASKDWRNRDLPYPPYICYLSMFVLAVGAKGDYAPHAYYPRLRDLLGEEERKPLPSFEHMLELWDDLEHWAVHDKGCGLGVFEIRWSGSWIHVGLPTAQKILSATERLALPTIFARAFLDPLYPPPDLELARLCREHGKDVLRRRTLDILRGSGENEKRVLLVIIGDELASWDGVSASDEGSGETKTALGFLHLCMTVDSIAGRIQSTFRCRLRREFPEERLDLSGRPNLPRLWCEEAVPRWSSPLRQADSDLLFGASDINWLSSIEICSDDGFFKFRRKGQKTCALSSGSSHGLPGLVETHGQIEEVPSYYLFHSDIGERVREWAASSCPKFQELKIKEGLPGGWYLGLIPEIPSELPDDLFPAASGARRKRIHLTGIRRTQGNTFFLFAPPQVRVEGREPEDTILLNGEVRPFVGESGFVHMPDDLPEENRLELKPGDVHPISFYLSGDNQWRGPAVSGEAVEWAAREKSSVVGASYNGERPDVSAYRMPLTMKGGELVPRKGTTYFLGQAVGEVVSWPDEPLPFDWTPVWGIRINRSGHAWYCGDSLSNSSPQPSSGADKAQIKLWIKLLWHRRKKIIAPEHPKLNALWALYQEVAKNA